VEPAAVRTRPFVEALSAANSGSGCWDEGWEIHGITDDGVIVHGAGVALWVRPDDCLVPDGTCIAPGTRVSLRVPKESSVIAPGFYLARGNESLTAHGSDVIVRWYWNLTPRGALRFVEYATSALNRDAIPFNLKVLGNEHDYSRCDAVVLYTRRRDYEAVVQILGAIYRDVSLHVKEGRPVFTKPMAPGVGLAENPGGDVSFGEHRCRLLADGVIRARELGKRALDARLEVVAARFAEGGVDLDRPFLNPGSDDHYQPWPLPPRSRPGASRGHRAARHPTDNTKKFLQAAEAIADRLSREAVWHGDRCNWLGAAAVDDTVPNRPAGPTYCALGPHLYDGTSGVALFLAELCAVSGDVTARRTAVGAMEQALSRVETLPPSGPIGLYTGALGIAFAAARVGTLLGEERLLEQAAHVQRGVTGEAPSAREFDLISGAAGAILAVLMLRDMLHDEALLEWAAGLGNALVQAADRTDVGFSWRSPTLPTHRNLTGFSHGAAGVGYALLELFQATGDPVCRSAAERAFDYERHWFDAEMGNWPDFRGESRRSRRSRLRPPCANLWCHGAPGIALSRLRAFQILDDGRYKAEGLAALHATRQTIRRWLHSRTENYSLCHGLAGNAEVLLYGCHVLGGESAEDRSLVAEVADAGIDMYGAPGNQWPCGAGGEETPSLMLGLAGIGHFYLRLHAPTIPSVLIPHREGRVCE
jgi:hypothetical protein